MNNDQATLNEIEKARLWRKMVRDNPHVVDHYFYFRVKLLLNKWFEDAGLPVKWSWFCIEYQERGTVHAHGCLWLECDPNISLLAKKVAKARQLQFILQWTRSRTSSLSLSHFSQIDVTNRHIYVG